MEFVAVFIGVTVVAIVVGIILRRLGGLRFSLVAAGMAVVIGVYFFAISTPREGDGFGWLLEKFIGLLAIWSALMLLAGGKMVIEDDDGAADPRRNHRR